MLILGLFYVVVSPRSANSKKQLDANPHKIKYKAIKNVAGRKQCEKWKQSQSVGAENINENGAVKYAIVFS